MAVYTPTAILSGDDFSATVVDGNFQKLSEVMNSTIGDFASLERNILNNRTSLDYSSFRLSTVTESFRSADLRTGSGSGEEVFVLVLPGSAGTPWGLWANRYDVSGSGLRFYLREAADVQFASQVNILRGKGLHLMPTSGITKGTVEITAKLIVDGSALVTQEIDFYMEDAATSSTNFSAADHRGLSVVFNHIEEGMAAGAHDAHIELTFGVASITGSVSTAYTVMEFKGSGGTTCATAFYK
jgi:hypothetical protein